MRSSVLLVGMVALFVVTGTALMSLADADDFCERGTSDASIAACTRLIEDGRS